MPVAAIENPSGLARLGLRVGGRVQGVGFRPFAYRLARECGVSGWVRNRPQGVELEVQGTAAALGRFADGLAVAPWPIRVDSLEHRSLDCRKDERDFTILPSVEQGERGVVAPDTGLCPECLAELFDPADRRFRYPFINCTHCGPRYTITGKLPYDRRNTSMAGFQLCPDCQAEYDDPLNRRFHAQPNACPVCGPRLTLFAGGRRVPSADVVAAAWGLLKDGRILAVRGVGGFHLLCDAANADAVARLRTRKQREAKPFAVMVPGVAAARTLAEANPSEAGLLAGPERPIVLLRKLSGCDRQLVGVAPGVREIGIMLPYAPLHYLLFHEAAGRPAGVQWLDNPSAPVLVATSANRGGQPLIAGNDEAVQQLGDIADAFVLHDRDILVRCDDSVVRWQSGAPAFVRRARGYVPESVRLPSGGPSVLAVGAGLKNTVCLTGDDRAVLSQHNGDLDNRAACVAFEDAVDHLQDLLGHKPAAVVRDLHPDFHASRYAEIFAAERGIPCLSVQHHQAHVAAVAAEHGLSGPILGLALDGVGLGTDGTAWGGELLLLDGIDFQRLGHFRPLALPGGDRAAREPWRMGASVLHALGRNDEIVSRFAEHPAQAVAEMLRSDVKTPPTSSAGRLFDAAAALLGVRHCASYEGQAAMELEALAAHWGPEPARSGLYRITDGNGLDLLALMDVLARENEPARGAALFHAVLVDALAQWALRAAKTAATRRVVLAGGCFLNRVLASGLRGRLRDKGLHVFQARQAPPNDGGISLGQAWIGVQTMKGA